MHMRGAPSTKDRKREELVRRRVYEIYQQMRAKPGLTCHSVAEKLGFGCYVTMTNRFKAPQMLTLRELEQIAASANITLEELITIERGGD